MTVDLDALLALAEAATPGPWHDSKPDSVFAGSTVIAGSMPSYGDVKQPQANARFIAAAREAVPVLIARCRELETHDREAVGALNAAEDDVRAWRRKYTEDTAVIDEQRRRMAAAEARATALEQALQALVDSLNVGGDMTEAVVGLVRRHWIGVGDTITVTEN